MKKQKGITLIALIITIIVILILVAVSVRTISKSGLFDHAKDATNKWAEEQKNESNIGDDIGTIVNEYVPEHNWIRNGDNIHCEHCKLSFLIGDYLAYVPDKNENNNLYWRVMGVEDKDEDGRNEALLIKMANMTDLTLKLYGEEAYNEGPERMDKICKENYSSKRYGEARSIKVEDVNNTFEYIPSGAMLYTWAGYYKPNSLSYTSGIELDGFETKVKDLPEWDKILNRGRYTPDGINTAEKLGEYKLTGYRYLVSKETLTNPLTGITIETTINAEDVIFGNAPYWLATVGTGVTQFDDSRSVVWFGAGCVSEGNVDSFGSTFRNDGAGRGQWGPDTVTLMVCPVVALKHEIPEKILGPEI